MAVLVAMAVHDTVENGRTELTRRTLDSLDRTVDWSRHRLIVSDNGSCEATQRILRDTVRNEFAVVHHCGYFKGNAELIENGANIGTARAINKAWAKREPGQHCAKVDNDVEFKERGWLDKLEECIDRDRQIGIIGLKRKDLAENPWCPPTNWEHSDLKMLPHDPGQTWLVVEAVAHVMGTCQIYNSALLDKIGYLYQIGGVYGYDDALAAARCKAAGFYSCFWPHVEIDHLDPGGTPYAEWKQRYAGERMYHYFKLRDEYLSGKRSVYHGADDP